ncbi:MAG: ABC transporter permease [Armatimonadota bacterium]|nr:ABC transporter permease [Armatimonadota bacterium]
MGRRLAHFAGLVCAVVVLNFFLPRLLPGSPVAGGSGAEAVLLPAAAREALVQTYHLDDPVAVQFVRYLAGLARGDLGTSLVSHRPVTDILAERLPWTLFLVGGAVLLAAVIGGLVGWLAAWKAQARLARAAQAALVGVGTLPEFLVAMLAIVFLASRWPLFPAGGASTPFEAGGSPLRVLADVLWHAALPGLVLTIGFAPPFALLVRGAAVSVLGQPYLVTARAKGLPPRRVAWHALRNALPPVATLLGLRLAAAVAGAAVVERIFAYPGMGWLLYQAVAARDFPVLQGVVFTTSLAVLTVTLVLDLLAAWFDPRLAGPP